MWFAFAVLASACWGMTYIFEEHVYKNISYITSLAITFLAGGIIFLAIALMRGVFQKDVSALFASRQVSGFLIVTLAFTILAELFIGYSITKENAEVSSLIEITYPLFIALFGLLFFRENNANGGTIFGGLLIFAGVVAIYFFNR